MGRMLRLFAVLFILSSIAIAGIGIFLYARFVVPGPLAGDAVVIVARGYGIDSIAQLLVSEGVIENNVIFRLGGLTTVEILDRLAKTEGLMGVIAQAPADGELLPETYHFSYGDSRNDIVRRMQTAMRETLDDLWKRRPAGSPYDSIGKLVTMASIVEKETGRADERARVAGVFVNRLKIGMRLQSDPTVVYALTEGKTLYERALTRAELDTASPYNTYVNAGLPPGPIANPGRASLEAALNPAESSDLYFVADGTGGHSFARTLAAHNQNVARWRAFLKNRPSTE